MTTWIVLHEPLLRGSGFVAMFVTVALAETFSEARQLRVGRRRRWMHNLGLTALNTAMLRLVFPAGATAAAFWAATHGIGLLRLIALPPSVEIVLAMAMLDLTIYAQHRLFHSTPALFRFHQVHHADVDFDVTLGSRFHPVEMFLSMLIKIAAVVVIGASAPAVVLFELVLAATSLFNHGNVRIPSSLDRLLRLLIVTPAMHTVHHAVDRADRDSNFGFAISWWDHILGTYRDRSAVASPAFGLPEHQSGIDQTLAWMLLLPFLRTRRRHVSTHIHQEAA